MLLEEAERLFAAADLEQSWKVLTMAQPFRGALDEDSQWASRFAKLAENLEGKRPDKESLLRSLAALKPGELLRTSAHVTIDVFPDLDEVVAEGKLDLPGRHADASTRSSGSFSGRLVSGVRSGGLYPDGCVPILNEKSNEWQAWLRRLVHFVTAGEWDPIGVERFRGGLDRVWPNLRVGPDAGVALTCGAPSLSALPWEMIAKETGALRFFRTVADTPLSDTARYLRRAVESEELPPGSTGAWKDFEARLGGPQKLRDELDRKSVV